MFRKYCIYALLVALLPLASSCVTQPGAYTYDKSRFYSGSSKDEVWRKIIQFFSENNIQVRTIEKDSGIVYAEATRISPGELSSYADCGSFPFEVVVSGTVRLNIFADESEEGTKVSVNTDFKSERSNIGDGSRSVGVCNSMGTLEKTILDYI